MKPNAKTVWGKLGRGLMGVAILALLLGVSGCGGGGGGSAPAAPESVSLGYDLKTLVFSWPAVEGATHYRLYENPDGVSGYEVVQDGITGTTVRHEIALHRRVNARYMIAACNAAGCADSDEIFLDAHLIPAIGYFKASNAGVEDVFGRAVALSADGTTLAVGAYGEDSAATGVNGDQNNNDANEAGAVYVFTREGDTWTQQAYVKASNTEASDYFGAALALSADGRTLAVGAYGEDSAATGINGDQADNDAEGSGAVYLY